MISYFLSMASLGKDELGMERRAQIPVTVELLKEVLRLPDDFHLVGITFCPDTRQVVLYGDSQKFPEAAEGCASKRISVGEW